MSISDTPSFNLKVVLKETGIAAIGNHLSTCDRLTLPEGVDGLGQVCVQRHVAGRRVLDLHVVSKTVAATDFENDAVRSRYHGAALRDVDVHAAQNLHALVAVAKALVDACNV